MTALFAWIDRRRVLSLARITRSERVETYYREVAPLRPEIESCLFQRFGAIKKSMLDSVVEHCLRRETRCDYCGTRVKYWDTSPEIYLTLYPVTIYKDPPADGKDLKLVYLRGWVGTFQASARECACRKCGKKHSFRAYQWLHTQGFVEQDEDCFRLPKQFPGHAAGPLRELNQI